MKRSIGHDGADLTSSPSEAKTGGLLKIWGHPKVGSEGQAKRVLDIETRY